MSDQSVAPTGEVSELRAATARLTEQVAALRDALQTVNALREQQIAQEARLLRTEEGQHDQAALADHMVDHLEQIDARTVTRAEAVRRWRVVVIGVILGGVLLTGLYLVSSAARGRDLRNVCEQRNTGDRLVQQYLDNAIRDSAARGHTLTAEQRRQLALLRSAFPLVNCSQIH